MEGSTNSGFKAVVPSEEAIRILRDPQEKLNLLYWLYSGESPFFFLSRIFHIVMLTATPCIHETNFVDLIHMKIL